ncbi:MAG: hypothetical protein F4X46_03955 [Chloroflexi bacterium]|nr:hypothetical protein [Chloroflexota bacterium]
MSAVRDYLSEIQAEYKTSMAGEHAYRPALKRLLESTNGSLQAVNDPARTEIGMPDFVVLRQPGNVPIGIVEAKDIGNQLSRTEKSQQIKRYLAHGNLILTDYLEFRLSHKGRRPNLSRAFVSEMEARLGLRFVTEGSAFLTPPPAPPQGIGEGSATDNAAGHRNDHPPSAFADAASPHCNGGTEGGDWFGPEDIFFYAYAIFHSPTYRERYAEFLKIDFPRLPLTADVGLFAALVKLGAELVDLHLMKSSKLSNFVTTFDIEGDNEVARLPQVR